MVGATVLPKEELEASTRAAGPWLLMATAQGQGKRTPLSEFRLTTRGSSGVVGFDLRKDDHLVSLHVVDRDEAESEDCIVATGSGMMSRTPLAGFRVVGRATKGVRIVRMAENDTLSSVTPCRYRTYSTTATSDSEN